MNTLCITKMFKGDRQALPMKLFNLVIKNNQIMTNNSYTPAYVLLLGLFMYDILRVSSLAASNKFPSFPECTAK